MDSLPATMSAREYAAHRGVAVSYVHRMRRKGLVVVDQDGRIDVAATDLKLADTLHPVRGGRGGGIAARNGGAEDPPPAPAQKISVQEAVRRERLARAKLAELELLEKTKQLTSVTEVNRVVFTLVRQALNRVQGMSGRLRAQLAKETDPHRCGQLIEADVAALCDDMQRAAHQLLQLEPEVTAESAEQDGEDLDEGLEE